MANLFFVCYSLLTAYYAQLRLMRTVALGRNSTAHAASAFAHDHRLCDTPWPAIDPRASWPTSTGQADCLTLAWTVSPRPCAGIGPKRASRPQDETQFPSRHGRGSEDLRLGGGVARIGAPVVYSSNLCILRLGWAPIAHDAPRVTMRASSPVRQNWTSTGKSQ